MKTWEKEEEEKEKLDWHGSLAQKRDKEEKEAHRMHVSVVVGGGQQLSMLLQDMLHVPT